MILSKALPLAVASLSAAVLGTPAQAAASDAASSATSADGRALEEIVVTARRREERLQDTPVSVSAFSAEALAERQVTNTADLGRFTPNLVTSLGQSISGNGSAGAYFIRGIGQIDFLLNADPGVGVYVDGVYVARALGSLLDLVDVERVEVLRGPQGTLFGRNTIGGAVSITTRKPDDVLAAGLDATVGSFDRRDLRATVNVPLGDRAAASGAVLWRRQDGYVRRLTDGSRLGGIESVSAHAALRLRPTDALTLDLTYDLVREHGGSPAANVVQIDERAPFASLYNGLLAGPGCAPPPSSQTNPRCFNTQYLPGNLREERGLYPSRQETDVDGLSATAVWAVAEGLSVKSITGYRHTRALGNRDGDHTPLPIQGTTDTWRHTQKSQELQLLGSGLEGRLDWIVGAYVFGETGTNVNLVDLVPVRFQSGGSVDNTNYAGFGQFTFAVRPRLRVTAGARWTRDEKSFTPDQVVLVDRAGLFPPGSVPGFRIVPKTRYQTNAERLTPHVDVAWQAAADALVYATYSEGFKSGGFTQRIFPPLPAAPSFGPEKAKSYEMGVKLEGLNHRVRLNGAAFYTDYSNLQVPVIEGVQPLIRNAAAATIKGFEAELVALPLDGLRLEAGLGYADAGYDELDATVLAAGVTLKSRFPQIPRWTGNAGVSYRIALADGMDLTARVDETFQSATYQDAANTPSLRQSGYGLLGASLKVERGRWAVEAFGRNLADKRFFTGGYADVAVEGLAEAAIGRPREWGLAAHVRY